MAKKKCLIVYNPTAAMGRAAERLPEAKDLLSLMGLDYEIRLTEGVWHAAELALEAGREGFGVVVAAGGDGTANEVLNGLMLSLARGDAIPEMAVLSIGRGNDFSYGAGIPQDLGLCVEVLARGEGRPIDVGRISGGDYPGGRYFGNGVGIGFDTIVGLEAAKMKHVHGFMSYVLGALRTFVEYPPAPYVRLAYDGGVIEQKSHQVSIMNGKRMGGTFFMAPEADNHDGLLDLCMAGELTRRDMVGLMLAYTKGTQASNPKIRTVRSSRYEISAPKGGLVAHADGETICRNGSFLLIECLPSPVFMLCSP
jgi:YegS/Rv2252/BmrU family lipid kinase